MKNEQVVSDHKDRLAGEVAALHHLRETSDRLWRSHDLRTGLEEMVDAGTALLGADFGNIQLLNPERATLEIFAQRGFGPDFLEHFSVVSAAGDSACGRCLREGQRIIIEDVNSDEPFAQHRAAGAAAGFRAVQSTPLYGSDGRALGVFSTHFRNPHRPSEQELKRFDLYAGQAAQFIERLRADARLQGLTGTLLQIQELGNQEIARELHDVFSQELVGMGMELSALQRGTRSKALSRRLSQLSEKLMSLAEALHRISRQLHPSVLEDLGLEPALRQECEQFFKSGGIPTNFSASNVPASIPKEVALSLYRVVQESLRNIREHAGSTVKVTVSLMGRADGVALLIADTGSGFELDTGLNKGGVGIVSMEERLRLVNGKFAIHSVAGSGTTVEAFVPLKSFPT